MEVFDEVLVVKVVGDEENVVDGVGIVLMGEDKVG